ncbi:unnamed protein product [Phyllotreta striolata]|uniref:Uncharacterized protein n=1 Tax=Phyllotreta striolata TaxID=444603 RepID=A0A9N9TMC4_PHYSR|nr:unnamed protein product [Phyllotreta striolata]
MNIRVPRYEFCEENKPLLMSFIKKANQYKSNPFCNLNTHHSLSKILQMTNVSDESPEVTDTIDLTSDNEDEIDTIITQILEDDPQPLDKIVDDVASTIKEILQNKSNETCNEMPNLNDSNLDLDAIFNKLSEDLTVENSVDLGIMMISLYNKEEVIKAYIKHILIKQLLAEHSDRLQNNLNTFCVNYPSVLQEELTRHLLDSSNYSNAVLKFLNALPRQFRDKLLRNLLLTIKNLEECHFALFDALVDDLTETTSLNRLVEFMSKNRDNYTMNKVFGKFLLKVIQLLGDDLSAVEKPMSHIIENHRSIWKGKIQKIYQEFIQDRSLLSQFV